MMESSFNDCFKFLDVMSGGGGIMVSVLAFYSDNPSLNPAGYQFPVLLFHKKTK